MIYRMAYLSIVLLTLALPQSLAAHEIWDDSYSLLPAELDAQRGGFLIAGGARIDFGIIQQSLVNGEIIRSTSFSSNEGILSGLQTNQLQTLLQTGANNSTLPVSQNISGRDASSLVTIIRNTYNDALIQNTNILDITVQNTQSLRNDRTLAPIHDIHGFGGFR
jgi:hypothetical protein